MSLLGILYKLVDVIPKYYNIQSNLLTDCLPSPTFHGLNVLHFFLQFVIKCEINSRDCTLLK